MLLDVGQHNEPGGFLLALVRCAEAPMRLRVQAAKALLPYMHARKRDAGRFAASKAPLSLAR